MYTVLIRVSGVYFILFAQMLDTTVTNLALTKIAPDLGIDVLHASWIMTSFGTGLIISFPIANILSKKINADLLFFCCSIGFILTSLGCGLAYSSIDFIVMRFLQGLTSGVVIILSQSLLIRMLGEHKKALAMALWVSAINLAQICGPIIGAYIAERYGWRWIFFINVPVVAICLLALVDEVSFRLEPKKDADLNILTTLLFFSISICLFQYVLDFGRLKGWFDSSLIVTLSLASFGSFVVFLFLNSKHKYMILDLALFKEYNFAFSVAVISVGNGLIFSSLLLLPIWLQLDYGMPAIQAGIVVSFGSIVVAFLSPLVGHYIKAGHYVLCAVLSLACLSVSYLMMSEFKLDTGIDYILTSRVIFGLGVALFTVPLTALSLSNLASSQYVGANAINLTLRVMLANFCTSIGFVLFARQSYLEYQQKIAGLDRFSILEQTLGFGADVSTVFAHARTEAFGGLFIVYSLLFLAMSIVIYVLNSKAIQRTAKV